MRSVPSGSFVRLSSTMALWRAWTCYAAGKRRRPSVARFSLDADTRIFELHRSLRTGRYRPLPYRQSVVRDPKLRLISAPAITDRVLHQAIVSELAPVYNRSYIDHSYACLAGRGPQRAVLCYLRWTRQHRLRLSLDIRRYFASVDHEILLERVLLPRLRDERTRRLLGMLIEHGGGVYRTPLAQQVLDLHRDPLPPNTGLPIGSCLSQWAANLYLDGLDHFVKRQLRIAGYLRYLDDFTLFAADPDVLLAARTAISTWLADRRRLQLNPKKHRICSTRQPSTFLGYRVSRAGLCPGRKVRRRLKLKRAEAAARGPDTLQRSLLTYRALVDFG